MILEFAIGPQLAKKYCLTIRQIPNFKQKVAEIAPIIGTRFKPDGEIEYFDKNADIKSVFLDQVGKKICYKKI